MADIRQYFAVIDQEEAGYNIAFPDLPGCYTCADSLEEAPSMAKEALELWLYGLEEDGEPIPKASDLKEIHLEKAESALLVQVNLDVVRKDMKSRTVKKTLSIPAWLNEKALQENINFSQTLQEALVEQLGL